QPTVTMANAVNRAALPDFVSLTNNISFYEPKAAENNNASVSQTIILCSWMGALPKHIKKYTTAHRSRSPNAEILLVESTVSDIIFPPAEKALPARYQAGVDVLRSAVEGKQSILLHVFSNGGCASAIRLASVWRLETNKPLPINAMVLDSCPGSGSLQLGAKAITLAFPKDVQWLAALFTWIILIPLFTVMGWLGVPNPINAVRQGMNDTGLFPLSTPRTYIYSKGDELVPPETVESHSVSATEAGFRVKSVLFERSAHVNHVAEDQEKYWRAVDEVQKM
ncbi:hypothetical protein BAUCODRAFT_62038, partial [Baudoinia panamericana UAMH 10762]